LVGPVCSWGAAKAFFLPRAAAIALGWLLLGGFRRLPGCVCPCSALTGTLAGLRSFALPLLQVRLRHRRLWTCVPSRVHGCPQQLQIRRSPCWSCVFFRLLRLVVISAAPHPSPAGDLGWPASPRCGFDSGVLLELRPLPATSARRASLRLRSRQPGSAPLSGSVLVRVFGRPRPLPHACVIGIPRGLPTRPLPCHPPLRLSCSSFFR
jgi:hypothetical protein